MIEVGRAENIEAVYTQDCGEPIFSLSLGLEITHPVCYYRV
jgi:hypothetical protein